MSKISDLTLEEFPSFCREHGLKCTVQRMAVFEAIRLSKSHPTVDEALEVSRKSASRITRESVYRILNEFVELGLLSRLDALPHARYDTWTGSHAHFICEKCGKIIDYPMPNQVAVPDEMPAVRHHCELRVSGLCDKCRKGK